MMRYKQGFTLIEVLIAVAVIGILAGIAFPSYQQYIRATEFNLCAKHIMTSRLTATNLIMSNNSSVPASLDGDPAQLGLADGYDCSAITVVAVEGGVLTVSGEAGGKTFQIQRSAAAGIWSCKVDGTVAESCPYIK